MTSATLLSQVLDATTRNDTLSGDELRSAASAIANAAAHDDLAVVPVEAAGSRLIGAALYGHTVRTINTTGSLIGERILLVAGYVVGTSEIAAAARLFRLRGAERVDVAVLGECPSGVTLCDHVIEVGRLRHLRAV